MRLVEQLANTGSEVSRSLKWREKGNLPFFEKAITRAFELLDLTIADPKNKLRLNELTRAREALADYFFGDNEFKSSPSSWNAYFSEFNYASRLNS
jgi:hypothetical protein